jgi:hypothetical protein
VPFCANQDFFPIKLTAVAANDDMGEREGNGIS